uniref:Uncharacterized protein n=1 Tax=Rhizophora mucronata TaxID=61149 RepID=A0A2P2Q668_RHIMU
MQSKLWSALKLGGPFPEDKKVVVHFATGIYMWVTCDTSRVPETKFPRRLSSRRFSRL